mmetsp:Transcript_24806/g.78083  ORF Transcript_24806/g.78083 Transcript_24806/m.78083 type:complete len:174 (+) Transcript_24806:182-703(+)
MGQGSLNPLQTCETATRRHGDYLREKEASEVSIGNSSLQDILATCEDINLRDSERPRKKRGVRRPLLKGCQRPSKGDAGVTALMVAAQFGSVESIRRLLSERANVDAVDTRGWTALHWAAQEGHPEVCLALLHSRANIDATDSEGHTPLQLAAAEDPETAVKMTEFLKAHSAC